MLLFCFSDAGVVIIDNVWFYGDDYKTKILGVGDVVEIIDRVDDMFKVKYSSATGKIHKDVLIDLNEEIAEDKLFVFARGYFDEGGYKKSARLFDTFIQNFDESKYLAEALYYCGLAHEEMAKQFNGSNTIEGIVLNKRINQWYYRGDVYKRIVEEFPENIYASKAAYRLVKIFRIMNLPWNDSIQLVHEELNRWQKFTTKYRTHEDYIAALLEIGFLNRVLYEMTNNQEYKKEAIKKFEHIIEECPSSVYAAQSRLYLHEIEKGIPIYNY